MGAALLTMRRLLLSIHDVGPRSESAVDQLQARLLAHAPVDRIAMLVVPDHWGAHPLIRGSAFATRLRRWADAGTEMFVHGWYHRDDAGAHGSARDRFRARHMTAGEGEFLGLSLDVAVQRMRDGRALIEDITGRPAAGFIAPAWLYGAPALEALSTCGFALAEDHMKVWRPRGGHVLARGPVITWASRSRPRIASSLAAAAVLPTILRPVPVARLAVHPGDVTVPALLRSIDRTVASLARTRTPSRYADLLKE
ncbi:DUF2334 domain-containing protein [Sphingobium aquiterrae]|uniref:DUF2334 domain-containing protein n=1 Tax=Sphingobium aquiterrae TaxID=2038656 RepID=UPI00301848F0